VTGTALRESSSADEILALADRIAAETGLVPVIAVSRDRELRRRIETLPTGRDWRIVPADVHYPAIAHVLAQCEFLLGGRYHMAIMAATVGTPAILLPANTFKNEGLAAMLRSPRPVRYLEDAEAILDDVRALTADPAGERSRLTESVGSLLGAIEAAQDWLARIVRGEAVEPPPALARPPGAAVASAERRSYYCDVAARTAAERRFPKTRSAAARFGARPDAADLVEALLGGIEGDPQRTRAALTQIVASFPTLGVHAGRDLRERLSALTGIDPEPSLFARLRAKLLGARG
jgi:hypothetical protein